MCPDLILLPVNIPYYSIVSEQVMSVLEPFADILEQASIDEAFLDCTNKVKENAAAIPTRTMTITDELSMVSRFYHILYGKVSL